MADKTEQEELHTTVVEVAAFHVGEILAIINQKVLRARESLEKQYKEGV